MVGDDDRFDLFCSRELGLAGGKRKVQVFLKCVLLTRGGIGKPDLADLAAITHGGQRRSQILGVDIHVLAMHLVQIHVFHSQPLEAGREC